MRHLLWICPVWLLGACTTTVETPAPGPDPAPSTTAPAPNTTAPAPETAPSEDTPQAIVLVTMDTLRGDFMTFAGHDHPTTPYMQTLADEGVYFTSAFAPCSWTAPSMATIMTGVAPMTHGVNTGRFTPKTGEVSQPILADSLTTLAETLQGAGYKTIGVPSNRHLAANLGFKQGFGHYVDRAPFLEAEGVNKRVRQQLEAAFGENWRTEWKRSKTFLWIHYFDPHIPFKVHDRVTEFAPDFEKNPEAYPANLLTPQMEKRYQTHTEEDQKNVRAMYAQEVRWLDDQFRLMANELGLDDPRVATLITSDHGEELLDHAHISHGKTLYDEVLRVPFLVHWKGGELTHREVKQPVSLLDVLPTLAELADAEIPSAVQGTSLVPALRGAALPETRELVFELKPRAGGPKYRMVGYTDGRWKLVRSREPGLQAPSLFDLKADPKERQDVISEHPEVATRLEQALVKALETLPEAGEVDEHQSNDPELIKELEALGYIGD